MGRNQWVCNGPMVMFDDARKLPTLFMVQVSDDVSVPDDVSDDVSVPDDVSDDVSVPDDVAWCLFTSGDRSDDVAIKPPRRSARP